MVEIIEVDNRGPMPKENADFIQVVRRQDEQDPQRTLVDVDVFICATGQRESIAAEIERIESAPLADIVEAAAKIAEGRDIGTVYVANLAAER
jgi:hypothetical protein